MRTLRILLLAAVSFGTVLSTSIPRFAGFRRQGIGNALFPGLTLKGDGCPSNQQSCDNSWAGCCLIGDVCCEFGCCPGGSKCFNENKQCLDDAGKSVGYAGICPAGSYKCDGQFSPDSTGGPCCDRGRTCDTTGCYKDKVQADGKPQQKFFFKNVKPSIPLSSSSTPAPQPASSKSEEKPTQTLAPGVVVPKPSSTSKTEEKNPEPTSEPTSGPARQPEREPDNEEEASESESNNKPETTKPAVESDRKGSSTKGPTKTTDTGNDSRKDGSEEATTTFTSNKGKKTWSVVTTTDSEGNVVESSIEIIANAKETGGPEDKDNGSQSGGGGNSKGKITGIVVGCLGALILLLIIAIIIIVRRRRQESKASDALSPSSTSSASGYTSLAKNDLKNGSIYEVSSINHNNAELDGRSVKEMYVPPAEMEHPIPELPEQQPVEMFARHSIPRVPVSRAASNRTRKSTTTVGANSVALLSPASETATKESHYF